MAEQFKDQGGVASSNPSGFTRWLSSKVISRITSLEYRDKKRSKREKRRIKEKRPHVVEYFHQVDDGYSLLAAQTLKPLLERYDIELICHLVPGPQGDNAAEPELWRDLSRHDAHLIAGHYGLECPQRSNVLNPKLQDLASAILANQDNGKRIDIIEDVGRALWRNDENHLTALAAAHGEATAVDTQTTIAHGQDRRSELKHYLGAMFYYEGEWYWGIDRLHYLEQRLVELGARKPGASLIAPKPQIQSGPLKDNGSLTLEIYPSLRSPYTAIIFDKAIALAKETGVNLSVRPVLPMVMRGVPATREKGLYIFSDCVREADNLGVPYGNFYDPIGDPVRKAYSLYPWACKQGKGIELISAFLSCAFSEGVNTNTDTGLQKVVTKAGLDWNEAKAQIGNTGWQEQLEDNRLSMYGFGSWGVPSFRLIDSDGEEILALWGQDRLWLFAEKIQTLLREKQ